VGEIGITPADFKRLRWWEVRSIVRGYNRRHMNLWSATRWQTYNLMASFVGGDKLSEHGINGPRDLIRFPWENTQTVMSPDEVKSMQDEIAAINAMNKPPQ
jgi:hypothetical protein